MHRSRQAASICVVHNVFFFSFSLQPLHLSASPAAANNGRRGRPRGSIIRSSLASQRLLSSDLDLQKSITEVRKTLHRCRKSGREMIATFDNLKRLCIDHCFKEEIESGMGACMELVHSDDLLDATISFRLMREAGHDVSADDDVLRRFTNSAGEFRHSFSKDIVGLLSLHDMSHLDTGEEASLLHKAKEFSTKNLASAITNLESGLATYVRQSLDHPYHLSLMQYKARHHLSYLQSLHNRNTAEMEELAIAEFQLNKLLHQKEMVEIKRWWMNLGLAQEIPVARDQILKWYTWSMTILQGSSFSRYRVEITKIIAIAYVVDDIFDLIGTLEELSLFTEAIKMWDTAAADSLPSCMRLCYKAVYTVTNEMAYMAEKEHGLNPINHLRKAWAVLFDGFMVEAKWLSTDQIPSAEDYLRNGVVTSGVPLAFVHILFLLGHHHHAARSDAAELADHIPPAISSVSKILRLWDDMGSAKDEAQEGLDGSYRALYLIENPTGDAEEHMQSLIAREWQKLNRECFSRRTFVSGSFSQACFNAARMDLIPSAPSPKSSTAPTSPPRRPIQAREPLVDLILAAGGAHPMPRVPGPGIHVGLIPC